MQKGVLKLYGEIWEWNDNSASNFIARLNGLDSQRLNVINLHVHCKGGDVLEGIAIYNAIRACKTPVDLYVDGVAASMMTIVMLACRNVYMADNAFLMIHAPSGGAYGTAKVMIKVAKVLKSMEKNFIREYTTKTGKTEAEVSNWLDGGDNWFSAQEALSEKLIDGVVEAVDTKATPPKNDELKTTNANMLYNRFAALNTDKANLITNTKKSMDKQKMIDLYGLTTVTAESSDEAVMEAINAKIKASEDAKVLAENALKAEKTSQVTALVDSAVTAKKITEVQKSSFVAIGTNAGIEALQTALDAIKPVGSIIGSLSGQGGNASATGREAWTWDDYQEKDPKALTAMEKADNATFLALYNAKYKK